MALTNAWKQRKQLIRAGFFKSEVNAWGGNPNNPWNWSDAKWLPQLKESRKAVVDQWLKETGKKRSQVTPLELTRSIKYRRMVRKWYTDHGWTTGRGDIDPFAALRSFREPWAKSPQGRDYIPPWFKRRNEVRKRTEAIDQRFSTAAGLGVI